MELTPDRLTVIVEALREYRVRVDLERRVIIESMILELLHELAARVENVSISRG